MSASAQEVVAVTALKVAPQAPTESSAATVAMSFRMGAQSNFQAWQTPISPLTWAIPAGSFDQGLTARARRWRRQLSVLPRRAGRRDFHSRGSPRPIGVSATTGMVREVLRSYSANPGYRLACSAYF